MNSSESHSARGLWFGALLLIGLVAGCRTRTIVLDHRTDADVNHVDCVAHTDWFRSSSVRCR
jgi:hypothetical protein